MEVTDLLIMDVIPKSGASNDKRLGKFKKYLKKFHGINTHFLETVVDSSLFKKWENYVALPKENCREYDKLKMRLENSLGKKVTNHLVNDTYFLFRTETLQKRNLKDKVEIFGRI